MDDDKDISLKNTSLKNIYAESLDALSAHELEERIALLANEIERCKKAIEQRAASRSAAEAFFKK